MAKGEFSECENAVQLHGKVALVTGATSGTGLEVARNLAKRGARVIIASRDRIKLKDAKNKIKTNAAGSDIITRQVDFNSLSSIRHLVDKTIKTEPRLDILINTVGAVGLQDSLTQDHLHSMMQVNYYGMFLLTYLLFPLMRASAPSRIVNVGSSALLLGNIDIETWNDVGRYSSFGYYSNAKLANLLFSLEMDRRVKGSGVSVYSMDPGFVNSKFFRNSENELVKTLLHSALSVFGSPPVLVAKMPVFLAVDPRVEGLSGRHFRDCREFYSSWYANDTALRERLWDHSKKAVNVRMGEEWETDFYGCLGVIYV